MSRPDIDDPHLSLQEMFDRWPATAAVLLARGMACLGCPIAPFHTVHDACRDYGLDEPGFRTALRLALAAGPVRDQEDPAAPGAVDRSGQS